MTIFQGLPSRLYPRVLDAILLALEGQKTFEFHYPYNVKKYEDWLKPDNILRGIPIDCMHQRFDCFMYGVFNSTHLNIKPEEDYIFTLLHDPIDQIYECYAYLQFTHNACGPRIKENLTQDKRNAPQRHLAEVEIYKNFENVSIERFVDLVLEDFDFSFTYKGIEYVPIPEIIYGYGKTNYFNYIGKYTELDLFFKKISSVLSVEIKPPQDQRPNAFKGEFYKRDLLEKKFEKQIHFYNNLK
jgi:hypothetical protein